MIPSLPTLEAYVEHYASTTPDVPAIVTRQLSLTYAELWAAVLSKVDSLKSDPRQIIVFRATASANFIVDYLAIHLSGRTAAPLEKDVPDDVFKQIEEQLTAVEIPDDIADILYTTGTTGKPKGVLIPASVIVANGENLVETLGFHPDLTFLICGPLNHIGSLSKIYPTFMVGATVKIIDGLKDLNLFFDAAEEEPHNIATFLVPASIRMVLQFGINRLIDLAHKLEFIETGAAAISPSDMHTLCDTLPFTRLYNTYASTETGIIATYNFNDGECIPGCLGKAMKNSSVTIADDGKIICSGKTLMAGYAGDPVSTANILKNTPSGTVLMTNDLGTIDEQGRLHLNGREGDVINVGGFKVSPTEVESAALLMNEIAECICLPAPHPLIGTVLKLLYVPKAGASINNRIVALFLKERLESYKVPLFYQQVPAIQRTYNGKIDRKAYLS